MPSGFSDKSAHAAFECDAEQLLCLDSELHRELVDDLLGVTVHDEADGFLCIDAALVEVEELVLRYFAGRCLVLHDGCIVVHIHVWEGMCAALGA